MPVRFEGRVAVVTGGANGIGKSIALALAREGAQTWVLDVDDAAFESLEREPRITAMRADFAVESGEALADALVGQAGCPDLIVNNVGIMTPTSARSIWMLLSGTPFSRLTSRRRFFLKAACQSAPHGTPRGFRCICIVSPRQASSWCSPLQCLEGRRRNGGDGTRPRLGQRRHSRQHCPPWLDRDFSRRYRFRCKGPGARGYSHASSWRPQ